MREAVEGRSAGDADPDAYRLRGHGPDIQGPGGRRERLPVEKEQSDPAPPGHPGGPWGRLTHVQLHCAQGGGVVSTIEANRQETNAPLTARGDGPELPGQGAYLQTNCRPTGHQY